MSNKSQSSPADHDTGAGAAPQPRDGFVTVRGARTHNLKDVDVGMPRDALVVFTGVSGSGKSSLAFGTLYAEAQRRYLDSVAPYARRLIQQVGVPDVDAIDGLPPAVALQQHRGTPTTRSSVGSVTTISNSLRLLYSRTGTYPARQPHLDAEAFSPNTPAGACTRCHGLGRVYEATEQSMVPDPSLTIRERAIAAWPTAWHGQNLRDILVTLGHDVDRPWRELPKKTRDWLLFTDEQPSVPVYAGYTPDEVRRALKRKEEPSYMGTFTGARRYVMETFANTQSALMKKRVAQFLVSTECPVCGGKRLKKESLSVKFAGYDIADISRIPLGKLRAILAPYADGSAPTMRQQASDHPERAMVSQRIVQDLLARITVLEDLGLGYITLERSTPTLSPGELQRLRLGTQVRSNLFGVVYVLDEPSAGLHPADTEALLRALDRGEPGRGPAVHDVSALLARCRSHVHHPVGVPYDVHLVLDDEQRVARALQAIERAEQCLGVRGMQAGRRLIQHVHHAEEVRADLGAQAQSLKLTRRERRGAALQGDVAEAEVLQHRDSP